MAQALNGAAALREAFQDAFNIGAAVSTGILPSQGSFIAKQFNSITAENEMEPKEAFRRVIDLTETEGRSK
ncbi:endo-1,4-beta-xylanase [Paenibacillus antibioticophila]|uniref:endo-1,4-beta-xylanase n=1 Tax=Paenibacillus antibioticophila TaxID=1274374 RepID=UPI0005CACCCD|nr:endo-1,4-beta-xylanase [Paenibacillus antibioticophila]